MGVTEHECFDKQHAEDRQSEADRLERNKNRHPRDAGYVQAPESEPVIGALLTIGSVIWLVADKGGR